MISQEQAIYYLEIVTPDVQAMCELYSQSHGWQFQPAVTELGNASIAHIPGGSICGIRAPMHEAEKAVVRTYLRVDNIETSVKLVSQQGAKVLLERMEIPGRGIIAIYEFGGVEQGLWQL
jgi:uncharacterized protein